MLLSIFLRKMFCFPSMRPLARLFSLLAALALADLAFAADDAVSLLDDGASNLGWGFDNGQEFPGATGELNVESKDGPGGSAYLQLKGNFTEGGAYVEMMRPLSITDLGRIRLKVRSANSGSFLVRLIDSTGQCHQGKPIEVGTVGQWNEVEIDPALVSGGEHWGGADDGQWHGAATKIAILLSKGGGNEQVFDFADIQAEGAK